MDEKLICTDIKILTIQEAIRKRPTMYVGPLDTAHYQILWEFLCIARESACCRDDIKLKITLFHGAKTNIEFTGALSTEPHGDISYAELMMTVLHACRAEKPEDRNEFCLVGIAPSNALCADLSLVIIPKEGGRYFQFYSRGVPISKLESSISTPEADPDTTIIKFRIDPTILPKAEYDYDKVVDWCKTNLTNIETTIFDARTAIKTTFKKDK